jgi:hypothetical protein
MVLIYFKILGCYIDPLTASPIDALNCARAKKTVDLARRKQKNNAPTDAVKYSAGKKFSACAKLRCLVRQIYCSHFRTLQNPIHAPRSNRPKIPPARTEPPLVAVDVPRKPPGSSASPCSSSATASAARTSPCSPRSRRLALSELCLALLGHDAHLPRSSSSPSLPPDAMDSAGRRPPRSTSSPSSPPDAMDSAGRRPPRSTSSPSSPPDAMDFAGRRDPELRLALLQLDDGECFLHPALLPAHLPPRPVGR